ncbi:MAG TPA: SRPBCC domain-containing protein [Actinomycetota bacterium]|jgi:uncharacterized protein YndB with AHSA1/START domain
MLGVDEGEPAMSTKAFELTNEISVAASPEQVWDAIATGPGLDAWFMGRNEIEPREGGTLRTIYPGFELEATVTAWEPPRRLGVRSPEDQDGAFHSFEYLVDEQGPGDTRVRWVHTGVLAGDWEAEYEAMGEGDPMYLDKLGKYLTFFLGRHATQIDAFGPNVAGRSTEDVWGSFQRGLGLTGPVPLGERVRLTPAGIEPIDGVVDWLSKSFLGVRSEDGLYRFILGFEGTTIVGHQVYADGVDKEAADRAWGTWLNETFA